ncbi:MAG: integration host factor subunit beta [Bacteroidales bacterium]|jgi:DNA-binding protein HU-beta|nr:integration host factor subunit beta [Bacteroidales bacterium]
MTKAEVVTEIAKSTGMEKQDVLRAVEAFMLTVKKSLVEGEAVYLRGFGSFIRKKRAEKTARNITKHTSMLIPEHYIPSFKPAKSFMGYVKDGKMDLSLESEDEEED